jgi:hypothetical protein
MLLRFRLSGEALSQHGENEYTIQFTVTMNIDRNLDGKFPHDFKICFSSLDHNDPTHNIRNKIHGEIHGVVASDNS